MLKFLAINNLLSVSKKNKKKFLLVTNFTIAFIIAAIITSVISIYYENKLTNLRAELVKINNNQRVVQEWLRDTATLSTEDSKKNFIKLLTLGIDQDEIDLSYSRWNFHKLIWLPKTVKLAISDAKKIGMKVPISSQWSPEFKALTFKESKNFTKGYTLKALEEEVNFIMEFTALHLNNAKYYDWPIAEEIQKDEIYFGPSDGKLSKEIYSNIKKLLFINSFLNELYQLYNSENTEKISKINTEILKATNNSTNTIFFAFLLQIIIFIIIQIFEIRELK
tara:strand:+ start:159 stop:995 length:837 start_codon:yes stop_codon:yes gene_type:complete